MKRQPGLPPPLRLPLAVTLAGILIAGIGQTAGLLAKAERDAARGRRQGLEKTLKRIEAEQADIRKHQDLFESLRSRGAVGPLLPGEWAAALHTCGERIPLPGLRYELQPAPPEAFSEKTLIFHRTHIRLDLQLLHEEDLLNFLEHLQKEAKALVSVRHCHISRAIPFPDTTKRPPAHLDARCETDWAKIELQEKQAP